VRRDWVAAKLAYLDSLREVMDVWGEVKSFQFGNAISPAQ
jgi:hypothetical protein